MPKPRRRTLALGLCALVVLSGLPLVAAGQAAAPGTQAPTTLPAPAAAVAPVSTGPIPQVAAKSAFLMEFETGQVLYEQDPDAVIPPASLTKIMTLYLAQKALAGGKVKPDDLVRVSERAWAQHPTLRDSSLMYLEPGHRVTVAEVLRGIGIASGNDACVAIAEHLSGSVANFVNQMNEQAKALGLKDTVFQDPHGLSPLSRATAREMAMLARRYIQDFPVALVELHSQAEFTYPQPANLTDEQKRDPTRARPIRQPNRNPLLGRLDGIDGLKTGFIEEAGYNLIATGLQNGMRLIGVLLGTKSEAVREEQATALMTAGFAGFRLVTALKGDEVLATIPVYKGMENSVALIPSQPIKVVVGRGSETQVKTNLQTEAMAIAPLGKGQVLGSVTVNLGERELDRTNLVSKVEVKAGGFFKRLWDSLRLLMKRLLKR